MPKRTHANGHVTGKRRTIFLVQFVNDFRAVPLRSHPSQPYVRDLRKERSRIAADIVRIGDQWYEVYREDSSNNKTSPYGDGQAS